MGVYGATSPPEHLFLALDKNVSPFPWESIPILRGRAFPSAPFAWPADEARADDADSADGTERCFIISTWSSRNGKDGIPWKCKHVIVQDDPDGDVRWETQDRHK
jgi:hypothetical protein